MSQNEVKVETLTTSGVFHVCGLEMMFEILLFFREIVIGLDLCYTCCRMKLLPCK